MIGTPSKQTLKLAAPFFFTATALVLPGSYTLMALIPAIVGLYYSRSLPVTLQWAWNSPSRWSMVGLATYFLGGMLWMVIYGYPLSYFESLLCALLAPLVLHGLRVLKVSGAAFYMAVALGGVLAGMLSSYQHFVSLHGERAFGAMNNPIMFGDLSALYGALALVGVYFLWERLSVAGRCLLLAGSVGGFWGSLMSGSKGGWLSIVMVVTMLAWHSSQKLSMARRLKYLAGGVLVLSALFAWAPSSLVKDRVISGAQGAVTWFETGKVSEGSVSIRLEMWKQSLALIREKPLLGWTAPKASAALENRMTLSGNPGFGFTNENDLLQVTLFHGVVGLTFALMLYGGFIVSFAKFRKLWPDHEGLTLSGMLVSLMMLEFGLSISVLGRNAFRYELITLSVTLLSILLGKNGPEESETQGTKTATHISQTTHL